MQRALKPVEWRQLCAIAREQLLKEPSIDDGELAERIKRRLVALRLDYPKPHEVTAAMRAVERALARDGLSRLSPSRTVRPSQLASVRPLTRSEAVAAVAQLQAQGVIRSMQK